MAWWDSTRIYRTVFGWVVLFAWSTSFLLGVIVPTYNPPPELSAAMLVVVGGLFATNRAHDE